MELAQIRYVVALYNERNFTRAAKRCKVSQPSLSNGIKSLEVELGGPLFERSNMAVTPLGKKLRLHFENAIGSVRKIENRAKTFKKRLNAPLREDPARSLQPQNPGVLFQPDRSPFEKAAALGRSRLATNPP
jgi:LysR family transcriptional regulator, hydrogen peroxide-inducible genes activator